MGASILDSQAEYAFFRDVFDCLPYAAAVADRNGKIIATNLELQRQVSALDTGEGTDPATLADLAEGTLTRLAKEMRAAAPDGRVSFELRAGRSDRRRRTWFRVAPLRHPDLKTAEHFVLVQDHAQPLHDSFEGLNRKLKDANAAAQRERRAARQEKLRAEALEHFAYAAAHDLSAPLRTISMHLELMEADHADELSERAQDVVSRARRGAQRLQSLIADLLEHARTAAQELHVTQVSLARALGAVREDLADDIELSNAEIAVEGDLGTVSADPSLMHQLLANLVGNAIKYRAQDRDPYVSIRRSKGRNGLDQLEIADNGMGFDNAQKDEIFEPFRRLDSARGTEGSGVGLATCRRICERHGWRLGAKGTRGVGATFKISGIS